MSINCTTMAPSPNDETSLKDMKYRELQKMAKEVGVKANLARPLLIQKILAARGPRESRGAQDHVPAQQEVKKCVPRRSARISGGAPSGERLTGGRGLTPTVLRSSLIVLRT